MFDEFAQPKYTMEDYREWAGEITNSFLKANAMPTDTLVKIARTEELTPHQIEVLAGEANKLIHQHKYAAETDKYFAADFPHADSKMAIKALQVGEVKLAVEFKEPEKILEGPDPYEMFGIKPEEMDKTAEVKHAVKYGAEKAQLLEQKLKDKIYEVKTASESAQHSFIKQARQFCITESGSASRMKILGYLDHFVKSAGMPAGKKLLAKLAHVLMQEGLLEKAAAQEAIEYFTKEGDQKAPPSLISEKLPAQIVNGQHPLYITLKTVGDHEAEVARYMRDAELVSDKVRILKQKIRAL